MVELQIITPPVADETDALDNGLVELTKAICEVTGEEGGFGLGGRFGYGENFENDIFAMRRFYWGDCTCGFDGVAEGWHKDHPHAPECFQEELRRRFDKYDEESGYNAIDEASNDPGTMIERTEKSDFGTISWSDRTPQGEAAHAVWCKAHDSRNEAHEKLTEQLYKERGIEPSPSIWFCDCGIGEQAKSFFEKNDHQKDCKLVMPNFLHKRSGFEVRWYKWIGRDMETANDSGLDLNVVLNECLTSLRRPTHSPRVG